MAPARRMVVVGGDAAGMSAASQARRLKGPGAAGDRRLRARPLHLVLGVRHPVLGGRHRSTARDDLIARTPEEHRARGIDLRMRTEVTEIDVAGSGCARATWSPGRRAALDGLRQAGHRDRRPPDAPAAARHRRAGRARRADPRRRPGAAGHAGAPGRVRRGTPAARGRRRRGLHRRGDGGGADQPRLRGDGPQPRRAADVHARPGHGPPGPRGDGRHGHQDGDRPRSPRSSPTSDGRARAVATEDAEYPADVVVLGIGVGPETDARTRGGAAAGRVRRPAHRSGDAGARPREHLGGRRLRRGPRPGLGPQPPYRRWARTPTSTARSSAPTSAAATRRSPASSARRSARSATWRSPAPACARRTRARWGCGS